MHIRLAKRNRDAFPRLLNSGMIWKVSKYSEINKGLNCAKFNFILFYE